MKKIINTDSGHQIVLTSNCKWIEIEYQLMDGVDEWDDGEIIHVFGSKRNQYRLDEFMIISNHCSEWEKDFDGVLGTSYFTGVYIKLNKSCDAVQIWNMRQ